MALTVEISKRLPEFELNVSLTADSDPVSILGPSGAGKSMLLRCIAGIERPDRGHISLGKRTLFDSEKRISVPARARHIGMLFQSDSLFPHRTVAENIEFGLNGLAAEERARRIALWAQRTHVQGLEHRYPRELSGGEQQRAALARALATEPEALLLDEPLTALDTHLRSQVEAQLQETFVEFRRPVLLVTHNIEEAYRLGEKLMLLARGCIVAFGSKEEIFRRPPTRMAAQLTGCKNFSQARRIGEQEIEALDWQCRLRTAPGENSQRPVAFAGIRAHHIEFGGVDFDSGNEAAESSNVFPCWPVRVSETPFRVTLYLRLHQPPGESAGHHLQAEVYKEKWRKFSARPLPWRVRLASESIIVLPE
ncbi:MAG TPA: ATP-binding cassette domain-containing protein [Candidatus Aquilonibacter sp.]|nr:ATP-binding cassette domain-containing protein [Candidatus Aquilonibacter sp.]